MESPQEKIKLLCADLDGTLVWLHNQIFECSVDALNRFLLINDAEVAIFTGRALFATRPIVRLLNEKLVKPIRYAVCFNGAMVFDFANECLLKESCIDQKTAQKIFQFCVRKKLIFWGYPRFLPDRKTYILINKIFYTKILACFKHKLIRYVDDCSKFAFQKILVFGKKNFVNDFETLRKETNYQIEYCLHNKNAIEITSRGTNKGSGIVFLKELLGLQEQQIASIGNSMNDLPMFQLSGFNIAMYRSPAELKKYAQVVASKKKQTAFGNAVDKIISYKA